MVSKKKKVKLLETRSGVWLPGPGEWGKGGDVDQRIQILSYKMSNFWDLRYSMTSVTYCIIYLKIARRVDHTCSYTHKMVIM